MPSSIKEKSDRDALSIMDLFTSIQYGFESFFRFILGKNEEVSANIKASEFQRTRAHRKDIRDRIATGDTQKMHTFSYLATTRSGSRIYGEMEAADEADLTNRLLLLELALVRANTFEAIEESGAGRGFKYKVPLKEQVILASQLENYFRLDMLMTEVLDAVRVGCESDKLKQLLIGIRNHVARGDSLLAAIRRYPTNTFSRFFMSLIEVGEMTGRFSGVFMYGNRHLQWLADTRRKTIERLRGSLISMIIITMLVLLMLFLNQAVTMLITLAVLGLILSYIFRAQWLRPALDRVLLSLPVIGETITVYDTLNFTYLFSIMWEAGLTAEQAIGKAKNVIHNSVLREAVASIEYRVQDGSTLSEAFAESEMFDPMVVMAFRQGETTGRFEAAIDGVYYFYIRQLEDTWDRSVSFVNAVFYAVCACLVLALASIWRGFMASAPQL